MRKRGVLTLLLGSLLLSGCKGCVGCTSEETNSSADETTQIDETQQKQGLSIEEYQEVINVQDISDGQKRIDSMISNYDDTDVYSEYYSNYYENSENEAITINEGGLKAYACKYDLNDGKDTYYACAVTGFEKIEGKFGNSFAIPQDELNRYYMPTIYGYVNSDVTPGHMYKVDVHVKDENGNTISLENQLLTISDEEVPSDAWPLFAEPYVRYVGDPDRLPTRYFGEGYPVIEQSLAVFYTGMRMPDDPITDEERVSYLENHLYGYITAYGGKGSTNENESLEISYSGIENINFDAEGDYTIQISATDPSNGLTSTVDQTIRVSSKVDYRCSIKSEYGSGSANQLSNRFAIE